MATVDFVIPFWGDDPYRKASFTYLIGMLDKWFADQDPPFMAHTGPYNALSRSEARNTLARQSTADVIVFIDADSIPDPFALQESIDTVVMNKSWLFPFNRYYNLTQVGSEDFKLNPPWRVWRPEDGFEYEYVFPGPDPVDRPAAVGGSLVIHRDAWERTPGYDERFRGWGGEDRAFIMMLETLVGDGDRYPAPIYHLWHPAPESDRFDNADWDYNRQLLERYRQAHKLPSLMHALVKAK
jgi:glycosyltransferase involved in cell wall biosynthesis